jgi:hypothetical protein
MPQVGFKPTIPVFERAKRVHALDRAAAVIGLDNTTNMNLIKNVDYMINFCVSTTTGYLWVYEPDFRNLNTASALHNYQH